MLGPSAPCFGASVPQTRREETQAWGRAAAVKAVGVQGPRQGTPVGGSSTEAGGRAGTAGPQPRGRGGTQPCQSAQRWPVLVPEGFVSHGSEVTGWPFPCHLRACGRGTRGPALRGWAPRTIQGAADEGRGQAWGRWAVVSAGFDPQRPRGEFTGAPEAGVHSGHEGHGSRVLRTWRPHPTFPLPDDRAPGRVLRGPVPRTPVF